MPRLAKRKDGSSLTLVNFVDLSKSLFGLISIEFSLSLRRNASTDGQVAAPSTPAQGDQAPAKQLLKCGVARLRVSASARPRRITWRGVTLATLPLRWLKVIGTRWMTLRDGVEELSLQIEELFHSVMLAASEAV